MRLPPYNSLVAFCKALPVCRWHCVLYDYYVTETLILIALDESVALVQGWSRYHLVESGESDAC